MKALLRLLRRLFLDNWKAIDAEYGVGPTRGQGRAKEEEKERSFDWRPLVVLVTVAVSLTIQEYVGDRSLFRAWFPELAQGEYGELREFVWWTWWRFAGYVLIPVLAIFALPGERVRDYFISTRGFLSKLPLYIGLYLLLLPVVIVVSRFESFYLTYPFYKWANRSAFDFWTWEALYALQFLSLEFFFRGFMLKSLAPRMGSAAIFVMVVPYCMIHYGKPMPETLGAIVAGIVLGTLALRTKSIWGGVVAHVGVALTMDLLALSHCPPADSGLPCGAHLPR